jgi:predicted RecA/RadA family phage recombinase
MKNFVQDGDVVTVTAPAGGVKSGDPILVGALFGVCATDAAEGADVEIATEGVFDLPHAGGIAAGAAAYWDVSEAETTATGAGNLLIGVATETAGGAATIARIRLNGVAVL